MERLADVAVKRDEKKPEPLELIAASIIRLADGIDRMKASGLTGRAIEVLLKDVTGVPMSHIRSVLECGPRLRSAYIK